METKPEPLVPAVERDDPLYAEKLALVQDATDSLIKLGAIWRRHGRDPRLFLEGVLAFVGGNAKVQPNPDRALAHWKQIIDAYSGDATEAYVAACPATPRWPGGDS